LVEKGAGFAAIFLIIIDMKHGIFIMAGITLLSACNNNSTGTYDLSDSLGNKTIDTATSNDTAYYERMNQKTGASDTTLPTKTPRRNDTAYYERLPNKLNPPDSGR
jgi:hypothetical protein